MRHHTPWRILPYLGILTAALLTLRPAPLPASPAPQNRGRPFLIGHSVEGRPITGRRFGTGDRHILVYGGIHGGYEWNTVLLAKRLIAHYTQNPDALPPAVTLSVIPCANPDGLSRILRHTPPGQAAPHTNPRLSPPQSEPGRFNAREVDLNRNWDHRWQPTSYWGTQEVNAGSRPFSEPETRALRDYILAEQPSAVIAYHSAAGLLTYGGRRTGWPPAQNLAQAYADASGYRLPSGTAPAFPYPITGSAAGYCRTQGIPHLTVELTGRFEPEVPRNLRALQAVIQAIAAGQ